MCGIAGLVGKNAAEKREILNQMQRRLGRRGPDQNGIYVQNDVALVHTRLSVVDIENGRQPMHLRRGNEEYTIVYNGELYNTSEIKAELLELGYDFCGHSDTEVLLHAYAEWKDNCPLKLNGIYAFAVWEKHSKRLFIARDKIGVKPFFFAVLGETFLFASEIKALLAYPNAWEISTESIAEIMLLGPGRTPGCGVYKGIEELKAGHCGYWESGKLSVRQYWKLVDREHTDSFEETVLKVRQLVTDAIKRQLVSDVPIGAFLSGGLDSSIICSIAAGEFKQSGRELHTFSVDYEENDKYFKAGAFQVSEDNFYIEQMSKFLGSTHHRIVLKPEALAESLFEALEARDLPGMADVDSSLLLFCKEVKPFVTVALSGECADEIFGGYPWFKAAGNINGFPWTKDIQYRASFIKDDILSVYESAEYVNERYNWTINETDTTNGKDVALKQMVKLNMDWFMQTLLDRKDRMSMYSGLEVRVPFCDHRIAEYLYSVPQEYKDCYGKEKGLLREAVKDLLPEEVQKRKKNPYPKTHHPKYLETVTNMLKEVIANPNAPILDYLQKSAIENLLNSAETTPWYGQLMTKPQTIAYFLQVNAFLSKGH